MDETNKLNAIEKELQTKEGIKRLEQALKNRSARWLLKRNGELSAVEELLATAKKEYQEKHQE
jgi:hypothetical protein